MDWIQTLTIIGSLGGFGFYMLNRLERDIDALSKRMDQADMRANSQGARIVQLYKMFFELLGERRP